MKGLFSFIFVLFYLSLHTQAQILIEHPIELDMDRFDWLAFSSGKNIQNHIDFRNKTLNLFGNSFIINNLKRDKSQLAQIEQELGLYKIGVKTGLSAEMIQSAEEAIQLHWENIDNLENQIRARAGLMSLAKKDQTFPTIGRPEDYRSGVWELYRKDHEILLNMVEKSNEDLYNALGANDEAYAELISPSL